MRPGVFIPRPETEIVVDVAMEAVRGEERPVVVDVGTGSGAIALSLKAERPDARVFATDLSPDAVRLTRDNSRRLGLDVTVLEGDSLAPLPADVRPNLVVSNPPYVTEEEFGSLPEEVRADPELALLGGTELHRRLAAEAAGRLASGGSLVLEIGAGQADVVRELLRDAYEDVSVVRDLAGHDRVVSARLR